MVGIHEGVGALVMDRLGFIRHDTCEHHANARALSILDKVWPAQMNIPSVSQFVYLAWYILNDDWVLYRGRIITFIKSASAELLSCFDGDSTAAKRENAIFELTKPEKPNVLRWGTLAEMIEFLVQYFDAIQHAFEEERNNGGSNAPTGSVYAMCGQWVKWSGSGKLKSLLMMACEFVDVVWRPIQWEIGALDKDYNVDGCFKVFATSACPQAAHERGIFFEPSN
jgi:hypothetical protein